MDYYRTGAENIPDELGALVMPESKDVLQININNGTQGPSETVL